MSTFIRVWFWRARGAINLQPFAEHCRRRAGAILAARSRRLNSAAAAKQAILSEAQS